MLQRKEPRLQTLRGTLNRGHLFSRLFRLSHSEAEDEHPGLVLIQVDGLSRQQFIAGIEQGRLPFLRRLLQQEHYLSRPLYSGLPSTTPAVQAELFYGARTAVPAFEFVDRDTAQRKRMYQPEVASAVEAELQQTGEQGLLAGGSSYSNVYSGGAQECHFCASSLSVSSFLSAANPLALAVLLVTNLMSVLRLIALVPIEVVLALWDFVRGVADGRNFLRELKFVPVRVGVSILLREICVIGAKIDISRGLPVIHMNLFGYDEQSHRRGPESAFATWSLKGIDYAIKRVWRDAMRARRRPYDVWIYSDHGQCATTPYHHVTGHSLQDTVEEAWSKVAAQAAPAVRPSPTDRMRATLATHHTNWLWPERPELHDREPQAPDSQDDPRVAALGPVGFVYLAQPVTDAVATAFAEELVGQHQVPVAIVRGVAGQLTAFTSRGRHSLPDEVEALCGSDHPCLDYVREDLPFLCRHRNAGDLTLLGWRHGVEPLTFALERGSHAGIHPAETGAFALLPSDAPLGLALRPQLRPADIRRSALALLGRLPPGEEPQPAGNRRVSRDGVIRVMTYNAHSCIGTDGRLAPERVARVIAQFEPDVVALQELDAGRVRTRGHDQAEMIARFLQMQYYFHPAIHVEEEKYGNAILTHLPERLVRTGILPRSAGRASSEPRGVLWIAVEIDGVQIQVFNTHLGLSARERELQAGALIGEDWLGHQDAGGPCILCGDLNSLPTSRPWRTLSERLEDVQLGLTDHRPQGTFYSWLPKARIDHVFVSRDFTVEGVMVPRSQLSRVASDHLPLIVDLRLAPRDPGT